MTTRRAVLAGAAATLSTAGCSELYGGPDDPDREGDVEAAEEDDGELAVQELEGPAEEPLLSVTEADGEEEWLLAVYGHVEEVANIGGRDDHHWVDAALTNDGWASLHDGFADAKVFENHEEFRMRTHLDGEVVFAGEIPERLVEAVENGDWAGTLRVSTETDEQAETIAETIEGL